jgi:hypothetical protein
VFRTLKFPKHIWWLGILLALMVGGCRVAALEEGSGGGGATGPVVPAQVVESRPLGQSAQPCQAAFLAHDLPHVTSARGPVPRLYESNGAGLAIGDLNQDGLDDIVLGDLSGPLTVLWNQGELNFRKESIPLVSRVRAVAIVDVDGDGWPDIVTTNGTHAPVWLRNQGGDDFRQPPVWQRGQEDGRFRHTPLPGVRAPAYSMNWADLNGNGRLDLVTASYDAGMHLEMGNQFLFSDGAGVYVYMNQGDHFVPQRLARESQGLGISLADWSGNGRPDILVGNDFDTLDQLWVQDEAGEWQEADLSAHFRRITHNTMGFAAGDIANQGRFALFATDMKPYERDTAILASWAPVMRDLSETRRRNDFYRAENVLQFPAANNRYTNEAYARGTDATGWSWSGKFGDLDSDGYLDLYVVNGMMAHDLLSYLPGGELVEENRALRNDGRGHFAHAPQWALNSPRSGRGMSMADLNGNGLLDIVVNNLESPAQLFENRGCGGDRLLLELRMAAGHNPFAIGAEARLTQDGQTLSRRVEAVSGYLSGDSPRLHFGLPAGDAPITLTIRWPDGATSTLTDLPVNAHIRVER